MAAFDITRRAAELLAAAHAQKRQAQYEAYLKSLAERKPK
jgi:hypothetical protein